MKEDILNKMRFQTQDILDNVHGIIDAYTHKHLPVSKADYEFFLQFQDKMQLENYCPIYEEYSRLEHIYCDLLRLVCDEKVR